MSDRVQRPDTGVLGTLATNPKLAFAAETVKRYWQIGGLIKTTVPYSWASTVADTLLDDDDGIVSHHCGRLFARANLRNLGMSVTVRNAERLVGLDNYCVVCNHLSYLDFAVMLGYYPTSFRFIAKRELIFMPFIGRWLRHHGVLIDRKRGINAKQAIRNAIEERSPYPILIFAEGTRSPDGITKPFKRGGLAVLAEGGLDMLPVALLGTYEAFSKNDRTITTGSELEMVIGDPVRASDYAPEQRVAEVERRVRQIVAGYYGPERAGLDASVDQPRRRTA